jgi:hypothetical protein
MRVPSGGTSKLDFRAQKPKFQADVCASFARVSVTVPLPALASRDRESSWISMRAALVSLQGSLHACMLLAGGQMYGPSSSFNGLCRVASSTAPVLPRHGGLQGVVSVELLIDAGTVSPVSSDSNLLELTALVHRDDTCARALALFALDVSKYKAVCSATLKRSTEGVVPVRAFVPVSTCLQEEPFHRLFLACERAQAAAVVEDAGVEWNPRPDFTVAAPVLTAGGGPGVYRSASDKVLLFL